MSALSIGISITAAAAKKFNVIAATGPIQTSPPTVDPDVAQVGVAANRTAGIYQPRGGGTVTLDISEWRIGATPVGTGPDYTPSEADVGEVLYYVEQATETGGTADGSYPIGFVTVGSVVPAAPVTAGTFSDQSYGTNSGIQTYNVSGGFTGQNLVFSLQTAPSGVSITTLGVLKIDTDETGPLADEPIVVVATNSGGSVASGLTLNVSGTDTVAPIINTFSAAQATQDAPLDITIGFTEVETLPVTCYFVGLPAGETAPSVGQIIAGNTSGDSPAGIVTSFVTSVNGTESASLSDVESSIYDLYAVAVDAAGNPSDVASVSNVTLTYAPANHVFSDDFSTYSNGTLLRDSTNYVEHLNTGTRNLEIQSGTLIASGSGACNLHLTYEGHVFAGDHFFEATFSNAPDESGEAPVLFVGWQDTGNYYGARIRHTDIDIRRKQSGGSEVALASKSYTPQDGDTVQLERSGTDLLLKINGVLELTVTDTTFTGGKCGYRVFVSGGVNDPPAFNRWKFGEP